MNKTFLTGNIVRTPSLKTTASDIPVISFTVAVNRRFKTADGEQITDFIECVAWRNTAEYVAKYFTKGVKVGVDGSIQTRTYTGSDGVKRYVTEVIADNVELLAKRGPKPNDDVEKMDDADAPPIDEVFPDDAMPDVNDLPDDIDE